MAIKLTRDSNIPDVARILNNLNYNQTLMPTYLDYDVLLEYKSYFCIVRDQTAKALCEMLSMPSMEYVKTKITDLARATGYIQLFNTTSTGLSWSKESLLNITENPQVSEGFKSVIRTYQIYNKACKMISTCNSYLIYPLSDKLSYQKHRMIECLPTWASQNTGRVAMREPAIQNLPRPMQSIITVPQGYQILHTDSGQVEPRIVYSAYINDIQIQTLINLYDDAYYGLLHYCTVLSDEDIALGRLDFKPLEITDQLKASRQKIKTYGNAVMYGSKANTENDPVKDAMIRRIGSHPLRTRLVEDLTSKLNSGEKVFYTYFGTPIDISKSPKIESYQERDNFVSELVKLAINNPIQGTAADLMRASCDRANTIIMNSKKSAIINYVHDAGTFAIADEDYDSIADELADIVAYQVDDWIPIKAEPEFGRLPGFYPDVF